MNRVDRVYSCTRALTEQDPVQFVDLPQDTSAVLVQVLVPKDDNEGGRYVTSDPSNWFKLSGPSSPLVIESSIFPDNSNVRRGNFALNIGIVRNSLV